MWRSVTTITVLKIFSGRPWVRLACALDGHKPINLKASQVKELDLPEPAEC